MTQYSALARDLQAAAIQFSSLATSAGSFGASVNVFRNFEKQLTLTGAAANATAQEMRDMEQAVRQFQLAAVSSATQSAEALYFLASAGFSAKESLTAMTGVLLLAQATMNDVGETSDIIASNIRAFGLEASDATRIANVFTAAINQSQADMQKLGYAFRQVGPVAAVAGQSIEQTTAFLGTLFNIGLRGEQAGTALRNIFIRLAAPVGEAREILTQYGIATVNADGSMRDLEETLKDIRKQNFSEEVLSKLFGQEALAGGVALLKAVGGEYQSLRDEISGTNAAFEVASKQINTLDGSLRLATNGLSELALTFGKVLAPAVRGAATAFVDVVRTFNEFDDTTKTVVTSLGTLALTVGAGVGALGLLVPVLSSGVGSLVSFGAALGRVFNWFRLIAFPAIAAEIIAFRVAVASGASALTLFASAAQRAGAALWMMLPGGPIIKGALLLTTALAGLAATWGLVRDRSTEASKSQREAVLGPVLSHAADDLSAQIDLAEQQIASINQLFQQTGTGRIDAASAFGGTIELLSRTINESLDKQDELIKRTTERLKVTIEGFEDFEKQVKEYNEKGFFGRLYTDLFSSGPQLLVRSENGLNDEQRSQLQTLHGELVKMSEDRIRAGKDIVTATKEMGAALESVFSELKNDPGQFFTDPLSESIANRIKEAVALTPVQEKIKAALQEALADNKTDAGEIRDVFISVLSATDEVLAEALKPQTTAAKTLSSLEKGQKEFEEELLKLQVRVAERSAEVTQDLTKALETANKAAALDLRAGLKKAFEDSDKVVRDALGNVGEITGNVELLDGGTANIAALVAGDDIVKALDKASREGKSTDEIRAIMATVVEEKRQLLLTVITQLQEAGKLDPAAVAELKKQFELTAETIAALVNGYEVSLAEALKKNKSREDALAAERKRLIRARSQLEDMRLESRRLLLQAQQDSAQFGRFNPQAELDRGLQIIELEYQQQINKIKSKLDQEAETLGRELSSEEKNAITERYRQAAEVQKEAAQKELIKGLEETRIRVQRATEDILSGFADAFADTQSTLLEKGSFTSISDYISRSLDIDQEEIIRKYQNQLRDLKRELEDAELNFRDNPEQLALIRAEYGRLVEEIEKAAAAELRYTNTLEEQLKRRSRAIDLQIQQNKELAIASGDAWAQFSAGIQNAVLEYQKEAITLVDITKDAFSDMLDTSTSFFADLVYDSDNAFDNLKKSMLKISRQVYEGITKNFLQNVTASITGQGTTSGLFEGIFGNNKGGINSPNVQAALQQMTSTLPPQLNTSVATGIQTGLSPAVNSIIASNNAVIAAVKGMPTAGASSGYPQGNYTPNLGIPSGQLSGANSSLDAVNMMAGDIAGNAVQLAQRFVGMHERVNESSLNSFLLSQGINLDVAREAWCAAFVNANLKAVGVTGNGSVVANSFLDFGKAVDPKNVLPGDVVVQSRGLGLDTPGGHVGLATGQTRYNNGVLQIEMIAGNTGNKVQQYYVDAQGTDVRRADVSNLNQQADAAAARLAHFTSTVDSQSSIFQGAAGNFSEGFRLSQQQFANVETALANFATSVQGMQHTVGPRVDPNAYAGNAQLQALAQKAAQIGLTVDQFHNVLRDSLNTGANKVGTAFDQAAGRIQQSGQGISQSTAQFNNSFATNQATFQQSAQQFNGGFGNIFSGLLGGIGQIAQRFVGDLGPIFSTILSSLSSFPGFGGGGGGLLGGLLGGGGGQLGLIRRGAVGLFHTGGQIGGTAPGFATVPAHVFRGAQRYHEGGWIEDELAPNEVPLIGKVGERVLTQKQYSDLLFKKQQPEQITVNMHVYGVTDANSFRRSEAQIAKRTGEKIQRAKSIT